MCCTSHPGFPASNTHTDAPPEGWMRPQAALAGVGGGDGAVLLAGASAAWFLDLWRQTDDGVGV